MTNEENNNHELTDPARQPGVMSMIDFARLGDGEVAYIRHLDAVEAERLFPQVKGLPEGIELYALVSADGTPLSLRDNHASAVADAVENDLQTVSVH